MYIYADPKRPFLGRLLHIVAGLALVCASPLSHAQVSIYQEDGKLIRAPRALGVLGSELFGDKVNFYSGSLEFVQNDVSLQGNSALPVSMGRRLVTGAAPPEKTHFGGWDMEIPRLHGIFATSKGWVGKGARELRCSKPGDPGAADGSSGSHSVWNGTEYWHGSFMYIPGIGDQELLTRSANFREAPDGLTSSYPIVTRHNWTIRCLPTLASGNDDFGEGFLATAPDGTQYRFDWLVSRPLTPLEKASAGPEMFKTSAASAANPERANKRTGKPVPEPAAVQGNFLSRSEVWILPTRVTDRFGNSVIYKYDLVNKWQLKKIVSDEASGSARTLSLTYTSPSSSNVASVSDGVRTWIYDYDMYGRLSKVLQPDGSMWQLDGIIPLLSEIFYLGNGNCDTPGILNTYAASGFMVHPSGARGDFTLSPTRHSRAAVPYECLYDVGSETYWGRHYSVFDTYSLTTKSISGPGLSKLDWSISYPDPEPSWAPCSECTAIKKVASVDPSGAKTIYTFGTLFQATEGELQQTDVFDSAETLLRSTKLRYSEPRTPYGTTDQRRGDGLLATRMREVVSRVISQQGVDFKWAVGIFDNSPFVRPTRIIRGSGFDSRTEDTKYWDNKSKWILGQVAKTTEPASGHVTIGNTYDPATGTVLERWRYGLLEQTLTYNSDGTVASRRDGKGQATEFGDYKRGLARTVRYPDGSAESAEIDNIGAVTSTTDAAGFKTRYSYDSMGRLAAISYPLDGVGAWNDTTITYSQASGPEFDLPVGHWRQLSKTGSGHELTLYDGLLRPVYKQKWDGNDVPGTMRIVKNEYDFGGRTTFESYPKRRAEDLLDGTRHEYDALGRRTLTRSDSELGTLISSVSYATGFATIHTDARGNSTTYMYQTFDEPSESAISWISSAGGIYTINIYRDLFGRPRTLRRSGSGVLGISRHYIYDNAHRLCRILEPEVGSAIFQYDAANNVEWRAYGVNLLSYSGCGAESVPLEKRTKFTYDAMNRQTGTAFGDGTPSIAQTYTPDGRLETISSNRTAWTYRYNSRGLNLSESLSYGGSTYDISRKYDANGSLRELTYPRNNLTIAYDPNAFGEPRKVGTFANNIKYHPNRAIAGFEFGNGITRTMTQNSRGLPRHSSDGSILSDEYAYDANGNVVSITDLTAPSVSTRVMAYDVLNRLTEVTAPNLWGEAKYTYDALDNLTSTRITAGSTARYTTQAFGGLSNRLISMRFHGTPRSLVEYKYDSHGNVIQRGNQSFVFNQDNRMTSVAGKATYGYDGLGRRVSTVGTDGVNRVQVYSQAGQLMYAGPTGSTGTNYIYLHNHVLAEVDSGGTTFSHTDGLGSPVVQTNSAGFVMRRIGYEPYGRVMAGSPNTLGFTGHVQDMDTGLVYMQQRYYDASAGRMLSIDPVTTDVSIQPTHL